VRVAGGPPPVRGLSRDGIRRPPDGDRADPLAGLPTLAVDSLAAGPATRLLESAVGTAVDPEVSSRIVAGTGGNPLALIEAARELRPEQLTGEAPMPDPIPVGHALERGYLREAMTLPPRTRTLLLTAAADPTNSPSLLWRAGSELGFGTKDVAAAEDRHVLVVRDSVKFRHPLIRSALYYGATRRAGQSTCRTGCRHRRTRQRRPTGLAPGRGCHRARRSGGRGTRTRGSDVHCANDTAADPAAQGLMHSAPPRVPRTRDHLRPTPAVAGPAGRSVRM
jgi:hypothetical protein